MAPEAVTVNFVGVFDTVSSYGRPPRLGTVGQLWNNVVSDSFADDVDELRLALRGGPTRVVQLGAADEYRQKFSRTSITTSREAGVGFECLLPGVHSDIGGSYEERKVERHDIVVGERQRLITQSWYKPEQIKPYDANGFWFVGTRVLTNEYQFYHAFRPK